MKGSLENSAISFSRYIVGECTLDAKPVDGQDAQEGPPCQVKYCESSFLNLPNPIALRSSARQG